MTHEASRTGAPIVFLHFLRWVREHTDLDFEVLLLAGGPLAHEFAALAPTHRVDALGRGPVSYVEAGIARAGFPRAGDALKVARARRSVDHLRGFDVLYLNSTTSALTLRILPELPRFVVSHVHELDSAFSYWFPHRDREEMLRRTDWFVACSDGVARNLVRAHGVPRAAISRHYEFIDPPVVDATAVRRARAGLDVPPDARIVGASGVQIWRKGPDLFLQMAARLHRDRPDLDAHFVWVGGPGDERMPLESDAERLGLGGRVHLVGEVERPADLFASFDIFCLTSREDPYPLVMLEAAALGTPVVSFANGGAVELAGTGPADQARAVVVPYLDTTAMAHAVAGLLDRDEERRAIGRRGQDHVLAHHTIEVAAPRLHDELVHRASRALPPPLAWAGDVVPHADDTPAVAP